MSRMGPCSLAFGALVTIVIMGGCSSPSPPISVTVSPSAAQSIDQGSTVALTASVMNDKASKGISWSLTGPGTLSNSTGSTVTYSSPNTLLTSAAQVTVTASAAADQARTLRCRSR